MTVRHYRLCVLIVAAALFAGCASTGVPESREEHVATQRARHEAAAASLLPEGRALTLPECVSIALDRSLAVRAAEFEAVLAGIDTDIAFSSFLPHIQAEYQKTNLSKSPEVAFGDAGAQMADQRTSEFTIGAQLPIFAPQTWLIHAARQKGEAVAGLALERTRQLVTLEVTARYYACLSLGDERESLQRNLEQARELHREVLAREAEGLVTEADLGEVEVFVLARETALAANLRAEAREKAQLLRAMDLPPLAALTLAPAPTEAPVPDGDLADLVTEALLNRPELRIADRMIDIRRDEVRLAVANFLPNLFGTGGFSATTDSFLVHPNIFALGLTGVLTVFDGLKNVAEHEAAGVREEAELSERERIALAVILEVVDADRSAKDASAMRQLADLQLAAAARRAVEIESLWSEGLTDSSDRLGAIADRDRARAAAQVAAYRERVAVATLRDAVGRVGSEL